MLNLNKLYCVSLTAAGIIFLFILIVIYFSKEKTNNTRTMLFKLMIGSTLGICLFQLIHALIFVLGDFTYNYILWRFIWFFACFWWLAITYYIYCVVNDKNYGDFRQLLKTSKIFKIILAINIIIMIAMILLPRSNVMDVYSIDGNITYFYSEGILKLLCYGLTVICLVTILIFIVVNNKKNHSNSGGNWFIFAAIVFVSITGIILSREFQYVSILGFGYVIGTYVMYFINENPEIYLLKQINKSAKEIDSLNYSNEELLKDLDDNNLTLNENINNMCDEILKLDKLDKDIIKTNLEQISKNYTYILDNVTDNFNNSLSILNDDDNHVEICDTKDIIDNLIDKINENKKKDVELNLNVNHNLPSGIKGNFNKLNSSLLNIVNFSIESTDVGKITLDIDYTKTDNKMNLLFKVKDTGSGLTEEEKNKLLISDSGISISKSYIESIGGVFNMQSFYQVGTSFDVNIPFDIVSETPISSVNKFNNINDANIDGTGKNILVVDNEPFFGDLIRELLNDYHFNIEYLDDGNKCIYNIKSGINYDLILVDINKGKYDSNDLIRILKSLKMFNVPPVIKTSYNVLNGKREKSLRKGFDDYLEKPLKKSELERIIIKYFSNN